MPAPLSPGSPEASTQAASPRAAARRPCTQMQLQPPGGGRRSARTGEPDFVDRCRRTHDLVDRANCIVVPTQYNSGPPVRKGRVFAIRHVMKQRILHATSVFVALASAG